MLSYFFSNQQLYNKRYKKLDDRALGEGGFGEVFKVEDTIDKSQPIKAMKVIKNDQDAASISREINHLMNLKSDFVIQYFEYFQENSIFYIITEFCDKGDLDQAIKRYKNDNIKIPNDKIKKWSLDILDGLDFLHTKGVIHFDIKPKNIFLDQIQRIKLGDLGLARNFQSLNSKEVFRGTFYYMSPEVIKQENSVDFKTDIWSFGCVLYEMITLEHPFSKIPFHELFDCILNKKIEFPEGIETEFVAVLESSFERDKEKRGKAKDLMRRLRKHETELMSKIEEGLKKLKLNEKDSIEKAHILENLASSYRQIGDYKNYLDCALKSLEIKRNLLKNKDNQDIVNSLGELANAYFYLGDYDLMLRFYQESLDMVKRLYKNGDHKEIAGALVGVAIGYSKTGDHKKSLEFNLKALEMYRRLSTGDDSSVAVCLSNIGSNYYNLNDYENSLKFYLECLEMKRRLNNRDNPDVAFSLSSIGVTYGKKGDYKNELEYKLESLAMYKRLFTGDNPNIADVLSGIAYAYGHIGDKLNESRFNRESNEMKQRLKNNNKI